jgi:glycosyltransferase involved in cell wall biosynthesis
LGLEHDLAFDLLFPRHLKGLQKAVARFQPDLIHVTGPGHAGFLGALVAHRLGVPLVASWHTNVHEFAACRLEPMWQSVPHGLRTGAGRLAERKSLDLILRFYSLARMLFAPNPELCAMVAERCRRPVSEMYRGVDTELYNPARRIRANGTFVIGHVGRISAEKNVRLLAAVEIVLRQHGFSGYEFHVVGEGSYRCWLQTHLHSAKFFGLLKGEALADAYAQMDLLLFPSETDTFGNVVLEAAASGVPSLVSACGGPKYLVEQGISGYVASNPEEYAAAILRLASHRALHETMAVAARLLALTCSWNAVFSGVYEQDRKGVSLGWLPSPLPGPPAPCPGQNV